MEDSLLAEVLEEVAAVVAVSNTNVKELEKELSYIKNDRIRQSGEVLVEMIPSYFFTEAASSTGKYHPNFSQGVGGLLRHTKAAVRIAYCLLSNNSISYKFTNDEKDLIILAIIMHDSVKRGIPEEKYTKAEHPHLASKLIKDNTSKTSLNEDEINLLCSMINSHMGEWNKDYDGNEILEKPKSKYERFVHMCDYLSSQKFLEIKFDENNNLIY